MDLKLRHIGKRFKNRTVLDDISFDVGPRELVSIVGPSGVGKTTLLKSILSWEADLSETVVLVNEFGDIARADLAHFYFGFKTALQL